MKLGPKYDPKEIESEINSYLERIDQRSLIENELLSSEKIGYVEGPPTLNGEPHIGHLRGRIIKDLWYRYKTLQKNRVEFRAGWDTQGLPVELQAEKNLGLTGSKAENIKKVGISRIVEECKDLIKKNAEKWIKVDSSLLCRLIMKKHIGPIKTRISKGNGRSSKRRGNWAFLGNGLE